MNFKQYIWLEMSVERAEKVVSGIAHDVQSIGILTPMNPQAKQFPSNQNNLFVSQFLDLVRSRGLDPIEIKGKFGGNEERSFLIKNISKKQTIELGRMYDQQSVIWAKKVDDYNRPHFHYEYIENGKTVSTSKNLDFGPDAQHRDDNFSQIKNKKFVIPFFDPKSEKH